MSILDRIDNTIAGGLCPCGATPRPGSPYCGPDCEPTHISRDTDTRQTGHYATPMRWRPDLVTEADHTDLIPIEAVYAAETVAIREGRHTARIYRQASSPTVWHLRLDNGHRFVGCDLTNMGGRQDPITVEQVARIHDTWQRLERELGNTRHLEPDTTPQRDVAYYPNRWQHLPGYTILRHCKRCDQHVTTRTGMRLTGHRLPTAFLPAALLAADSRLEPCELCANCRAPFPGPPIYASLHRDHWTPTIRVRLKAAGYGQVEAHINLLEIGNSQIVEAIQQAVDKLETQLLAAPVSETRPVSDQEGAMRRLLASLEWTIGPGRNPTIRDITTT